MDNKGHIKENLKNLEARKEKRRELYEKIKMINAQAESLDDGPVIAGPKDKEAYDKMIAEIEKEYEGTFEDTIDEALPESFKRNKKG